MGSHRTVGHAAVGHFDGFNHVARFDHFHPGVGLHHHFGFGFHHGLHVGVGLGFLPFFGPWNSYAVPYYGYPGPPYPIGPYEGPPLGPRIAVPGVGEAGDSLVVEPVSVMGEVPTTALRITWQDDGREAEEVALFLADTAQTVLVVQTLTAPPYTALLEPPPETAFAGMTAVWPNGTKATRLVAYQVLSERDN